MKSLTPFAQMPTTPEPVIAQVRRQLAEDDRVGRQVPTGVIDRVADRAVRELWGSPVKTFVPILALRQAREILRDEEWVIAVQWQERHQFAGARLAERPQGEQRPQDDLPIAGDVLPHDERDVLSL